MANYDGQLHVKLISGIEISDLDAGADHSDPYCVFILGDEELKSKVAPNTANPEWNDEFVMGVVDVRYILRVLLYDRDEGEEEDDFLGYAEVSLADLKEDEEQEFELELQRATSGKIKIALMIDMQPNEEEEDDEMEDEDDDDIPSISEPKEAAGLGALPKNGGDICPPDGQDKVREPPCGPPKARLELEYVHGFRGHDTRQCAGYNKHGSPVWITAAVGIVYDKDTHTQRFFQGHEQDILCMAINPADGITVATGQWTGNPSQGQKKDPKIMVWNSEDCSTLAELSGQHQRGISCLAFSPSGNKLASVGMDDQNSVVIWDWKRGKPTGPATKGGANKLLMISFDGTNDNSFFTVGAKSSQFWSISAGGKVTKKSGVFGKKYKSQTQLVCASHRNGFISGAYGGELYSWTGNSASAVTPAHEGPIYAMYTDSKLVVTGGKDGKVVLRDISLQLLEEFNVGQNVRSVHVHNNNILVGTYEGAIMEIDTQTKAINVIMQGHGGMSEPGNGYAGELWGLDVHPDNQHYATSGEDRTIRIFNIKGHNCVATYNELPMRSHACAWHPDGVILAVAMKDGKIAIFDWNQADGKLEKTNEFQKRDYTKMPLWPEAGGIDELRFSPDGTMLATGCHSEGKGGSGGKIDIYQTNGWTRSAQCTGHTAQVRHLDWTEDSNNLHSTDSNPELLFWDARGGNLMRSGASALANATWASFSTEVGWPVQGIYRKLPGFVKQMDGSDVNMCDVNPDKDLLVVGDDFGNVTLYNYPCTNKKDGALYFEGHSSFVTNVKFSKDGNYVFSVGGHDLSIMQWRLTK